MRHLTDMSNSVQRHVSERGNVATITENNRETLTCILKILCRKLYIFLILLKLQRLVDPVTSAHRHS